MTKFIEFVDIKRLPTSDAYSYQDDTIEQSDNGLSLPPVTYTSKSYNDVRTIINKFDLSLTSRIITSGSIPTNSVGKKRR